MTAEAVLEIIRYRERHHEGIHRVTGPRQLEILPYGLGLRRGRNPDYMRERYCSVCKICVIRSLGRRCPHCRRLMRNRPLKGGLDQ